MAIQQHGSSRHGLASRRDAGCRLVAGTGRMCDQCVPASNQSPLVAFRGRERAWNRISITSAPNISAPYWEGLLVRMIRVTIKIQRRDRNLGAVASEGCCGRDISSSLCLPLLWCGYVVSSARFPWRELFLQRSNSLRNNTHVLQLWSPFRGGLDVAGVQRIHYAAPSG